MKKVFNFIKNNFFMILAAYFFISFVIGITTFNPSLDETTRKVKALWINMDLLWSFVLMLAQTLNNIIKLVDKKIDITYDLVQGIIKVLTEPDETEKEADSKEEKEVN